MSKIHHQTLPSVLSANDKEQGQAKSFPLWSELDRQQPWAVNNFRCGEFPDNEGGHGDACGLIVWLKVVTEGPSEEGTWNGVSK